MDNAGILELARTRLAEAVTADEDNRTEALSDLEHLAGIQWDEAVKEAREAENRPCLTINRLPQFVRQVTGDIRKLNPAIRIIPSDIGATKELADINAGIIRGIEYECKASAVYEGAAESAAQCGIGNFRILTEYESDDSFNQVIKIKRIHNPFAVYWDPAAKESTREDADWCMIIEEMKLDDFEDAYPKDEAAGVDADDEVSDLGNWYEGGTVKVAEYYWKEPVRKKIGLLATGEVVEDPTAAHNTVKVRTIDTHKLMWAKISGKDVLEKAQEVPCRHIPVVAVTGEEMTVGDAIVRTSVIRFARDAQKMYNYWRSASTEMIALQPKAPYLVTAKQIQGQEAEWAAANDSNAAYLIYSPDEKAGTPQRLPPPIPSAGMLQEISMASEDMKATTGIYDAGLGQRSSETSGVAIRQRQMESDISTSIYTDNLAKAIEHCGRILLSMIPKIYDTNRQISIVDDEDQEDMIEINGKVMTNQGQADLNNLSIGKYAVRVSVGPNYTTRRQETQDGMMKFVQAVPQAGQIAGDLIAKSMDWPDADKLAERLKKMLPPNLQDTTDLPPEQQAQMQQQMQAQQQQKQIEQQAVQIDMRKAAAEAQEAEADSVKAQAEAQEAQYDLAAKTGQLDATIAQIVQAEVAKALQGAFQTGPRPII